MRSSSRLTSSVGVRQTSCATGNCQRMNDELVDQSGVSMPEYRVVATPIEGGYELNVVDLGTTRTRETAREAVERAARDYLSLMLHLPADKFRVKVEYRDK